MDLDDLLDPSIDRRSRFEWQAAASIKELRSGVGKNAEAAEALEKRVKIIEDWKNRVMVYVSILLFIASGIWYAVTKTAADRLIK